MARQSYADPYGAAPDPNSGYNLADPTPAAVNPLDAQIEALYQQYFKRSATAAELASHRGNPGGIAAVEALVKAAAPAVEPDTATPVPKTNLDPGEKKSTLEGFDEEKLADTSKQSIKYRAARVFQQFSPADFVKDPASVIAALKAAGLNPTLIGKDQIDFGDGYGPIDVVRAASLGGKAWVWQPTADGGVTETAGTGTAAAGTVGSLATDPNATTQMSLYGDSTGINPDYLTPWTGQFAAPAESANPAYPAWDPTGEFQGPGEFVAPTAESILQDPSYQFRLNQGAGAIENSAASRGVLNSGGTLADILNYGQGAASQEYQNIWNRDLSKWGTDWTNALNKFATNTSAKQSSYDNLVGKYSAQNANATEAYNRAWNQFVENKDTWYKNQSNPFDKLYAMSSLGASASS